LTLAQFNANILIMNAEKTPALETSVKDDQYDRLHKLRASQSQALSDTGLVVKFGEHILGDLQTGIRQEELAVTDGLFPDDVGPRLVEQYKSATKNLLVPQSYQIIRPITRNGSKVYGIHYIPEGKGETYSFVVGSIESNGSSKKNVVPTRNFTKSDVTIVQNMAEEIDNLSLSGKLPADIDKDSSVTDFDATDPVVINNTQHENAKRPDKKFIGTDKDLYEEATNPRNIIDVKYAYEKAVRQAEAERSFGFDARKQITKDPVDTQLIKKHIIENYLQTGRATRLWPNAITEKPYMQPSSKKLREIPDGLGDEVANLMSMSYEKLQSLDYDNVTTEKNYIYKLTDPAKIIGLKESIDGAIAMEKAERSLSFDHRKEVSKNSINDLSIKERLIESYLHKILGETYTSDISSRIKQEVLNMIALSYDELEGQLKRTELDHYTKPKVSTEAPESTEKDNHPENVSEAKTRRFGRFIIAAAGLRSNLAKHSEESVNSVSRKVTKGIGRIATRGATARDRFKSVQNSLRHKTSTTKKDQSKQSIEKTILIANR
jgi:hypothetical protein